MASLTEIFTAIADAIRSKTGGTKKYKPEDMAPAIRTLSTEDIGTVGAGLAARNLAVLDLGTADTIVSYGLQNPGAVKVRGEQVTTVRDHGINGGGDAEPVLEEIELPAVRTLGSYGFASNSKLARVTISDHVVSLSQYLFSNDTSLTDFTMPSGLRNIYEGAFYECTKYNPASLPETLTTIGYRAFLDCIALSLTSLPSGITSIGAKAFQGCQSLALTSLPEKLVSLENSVFSGCTSLALTTVPDQVSAIGEYAFYNTGVTDFFIPDNVKNLGQYAFAGCMKLESVRVSALDSVGIHTFDGCTKLRRAEIASGTTLLASYTFMNCTALEEVVIPSTLQDIYTYTFDNCPELRMTELPRKLRTLAGYAFYNCSSVTFSYLPDTINGIYDHTLENCTSLTELRLHSTPVNGIYDTAFKGCTSLSDIYVPWAEGAVANAPWGATSAVIHYSTVYPAVGIALQESVRIFVQTESYDCRSLLRLVDQDGYVTTGDTSDVTWSAGTLTGVSLDAATGVLTLSNPAVNSAVQVTAASATFGSATTTITFVNTHYSVDTGNGQWVDTGTQVDNHTVYQSDAGSYHTNNGTSTATITLVGYQKFVVYIRSNAESTYDYTIAAPLDATAARGGSAVQTTSGKQSATTYYKAEYTISDQSSHTIQIMYTKDSSQNSGDDRGYFYVAESECE